MGKKTFLPEPGTGRALTVWIPAKFFPTLDALAAHQNISRSTLARQAVIDFLKFQNDKTPAA